MSQPQVRAVAPVLCVSDMDASMAYFCERLGFISAGTVGDPPAWASMVRDEIEVMLVCGVFSAPPQDWAAYFYVADADLLYSEFQARGADILQPPVDKPYHNREFEVRLPDGRLLAFGGPIPAGMN